MARGAFAICLLLVAILTGSNGDRCSRSEHDTFQNNDRVTYFSCDGQCCGSVCCGQNNVSDPPDTFLIAAIVIPVVIMMAVLVVLIVCCIMCPRGSQQTAPEKLPPQKAQVYSDDVIPEMYPAVAIVAPPSYVSAPPTYTTVLPPAFPTYPKIVSVPSTSSKRDHTWSSVSRRGAGWVSADGGKRPSTQEYWERSSTADFGY